MGNVKVTVGGQEFTIRPFLAMSVLDGLEATAAAKAAEQAHVAAYQAAHEDPAARGKAAAQVVTLYRTAAELMVVGEPVLDDDVALVGIVRAWVATVQDFNRLPSA